ncbi:hypothetical protein I549_4649 [Mycobacterium avium subsp. avium 2285 (R)]|nr:hypothetical protein I549_4649 [Mycobacterium avium subsp. avium 2285 (R)]
MPEFSSPVLIAVRLAVVEQLTAFVLPWVAPPMLISAVPAGRAPAGRAAVAGSEQPATPPATHSAAAPATSRLCTHYLDSPALIDAQR